jgi:hypothetical protein
MAHNCPQCGQTCFCSGDLEDHDIGDLYDDCQCCLGKLENDNDEDDDLPGIAL